MVVMWDEKECVVIIIKVVTGRNSSIVFSYNLAAERERIMLESTKDAEILFSDDKQVYILD